MSEPIKPAPVERDHYGYWTHPDFPEWDEGTTGGEIDQWFDDHNLHPEVQWLEHDAPEHVSRRYFEDGEPHCNDWYPESEYDGGFLLSIHDTEDGPVAIFAVPQNGEVAE